MKQFITVRQFNELSKEQTIYLLDWCSSKGLMIFQNTMSNIYLPMLTIGILIDFCQSHDKKFVFSTDCNADTVQIAGKNTSRHLAIFTELEYIDALWKATKKLLDINILK